MAFFRVVTHEDCGFTAHPIVRGRLKPVSRQRWVQVGSCSRPTDKVMNERGLRLR